MFRQPKIVVGFALLYFMGAVVYGLVVPIWEGPDEREHWAFLRYVSDNWRIPDVLDEYGAYAWIPTHAPLYYFAAAPFIAQLDLSDTSAYPLSNPQAVVNDLDALANQNGFVHTPLEAWPFLDANVRGLHMGRLVTAAFGALAVGATAAIGLRFSRRVAILAGLLTAFSAELLFLGGLVQNDVPGAALASLSIVVLLKYWDSPGRRRAVLVGVVIGLAALAKASNLALLGAAGLLILARRRNERRAMVNEGLLAFGATALLAGWWMWLMYSRYGDPTGLAGSLALMPGEQVDYREWANIAGLIRFTASSAWAVFGASSIAGPSWLYWTLSLLALAGFGGLAFVDRTTRRQPVVWVCVLWAVLISLAGVSWEMRVRSWHARHFLPALSAYAVLLAIGMDAWVRRSQLGRLLYALPGGMIGLAVLAPGMIIAPVYRAPPVQVGDLPPEATRTCLRFEQEELALLGVQTPGSVEPGEVFEATLYWRMESELTYDVIQFVRLLDGERQPIAGLNAYHGNGVWPTKLWQPEATYADRIRIRIPPGVNTPQLGRLALSLDRYGEQLYGACDGVDAEPLSTLAEFRIVDRSAPAGAALSGFGDVAELTGAAYRELPASSFVLEIDLEWRVLRSPEQVVKRFVHVERNGVLVAQADGVPANFPARVWEPGDVLPETVQIELAADAPSGAYLIWVGLYGEDGQRLPTGTPDGRVPIGTFSRPRPRR